MSKSIFELYDIVDYTNLYSKFFRSFSVRYLSEAEIILCQKMVIFFYNFKLFSFHLSTLDIFSIIS
jgi:hypothetical protein